jgi:hypothetical protein
VAEGPEIQQQQDQRPRFGPRQQQRPQGLFDLHGIGFTSLGETMAQPVVPKVSITVDGQSLFIPEQPLRASNENGYTDYSHYQVYGKLNPTSVIQASATDPQVQVQVSSINEGRATVTYTYHGQKKVYLIN